MRKLPLALAALTLLAAGCSGGKTPAAKSPPTPASTTPAAASPTPAALPALGKTQTQADADYVVRVTAFAYRHPLPSRFPPDRKGYTFAGAEVRTCLTKGPSGLVSWAPWLLTFADDTTAEPVSSWSDDWFQVPLYPGFDRPLRTGRCVRGWVVYEVPKGKRPVKLSYEPSDAEGMPIAGPQWSIR